MGVTKSARILVVEDEQDTAALIRSLLERKFAVEVTVAPDMASATRLLTSEDFDLVTLDYLLPDGNGLDILRCIREKIGQVPVIMVTAHGDSDLVERYHESGASSCVLKDQAVGTTLVREVQKALHGATA